MASNFKWAAKLLLIGMIAIMFAGCGTDSAGNNEQAGQPESAETVSPSPQTESAESPEADKASAENEGTPRLYKDALDREVEIPAKPERIVAFQHASHLLALGVEPVAMYDFLRVDSMEERFQNIASAGDYQPNLEALTALDPDLMISWTFIKPEEIEELSKIAPVVVIDSSNTLNTLHTIAEMLGLEDKEQEWLASYNGKAADAKQQLGEIVKPGETAIMYHLWDKSIAMVKVKENFAFFDVPGLKVPEAAQQWLDNSKDAQISLEKVPEFDADHLFIMDESQNGEMYKQLSKVIGNMKAVKNNHVYMLTPDWYYGSGPLALEWQLEQLPDLFKP